MDPHTHIFPHKDRANEFAMRVTKTYQEIAEAGGGILSSVKSSREATFDQIYERNERNLKRFLSHGTTTVEIKSGYGLNLETEILLLEVIKKLRKNYKNVIDIVPTFLGAHAFPAEYRGSEEEKQKYVDIIVNEMIPQIRKRRLAEFCDVFCENGYFDYKMSKKILRKAKSKKFKIRLHADEF